MQRHLDQRPAVTRIGDLEHVADVDAAHPDLGLRHQAVGAAEVGIDQVLLAPGPMQAHVEGDEPEPSKTGGGKDGHHRDADDDSARHQPAEKH